MALFSRFRFAGLEHPPPPAGTGSYPTLGTQQQQWIPGRTLHRQWELRLYNRSRCRRRGAPREYSRGKKKHPRSQNRLPTVWGPQRPSRWAAVRWWLLRWTRPWHHAARATAGHGTAPHWTRFGNRSWTALWSRGGPQPPPRLEARAGPGPSQPRREGAPTVPPPGPALDGIGTAPRAHCSGIRGAERCQRLHWTLEGQGIQVPTRGSGGPPRRPPHFGHVWRAPSIGRRDVRDCLSRIEERGLRHTPPRGAGCSGRAVRGTWPAARSPRSLLKTLARRAPHPRIPGSNRQGIGRVPEWSGTFPQQEQQQGRRCRYAGVLA